MRVLRLVMLAGVLTLAAATPASASAGLAQTVNSQVTDSVTQTNVKILGEAPAMAMGSLYQTIGNSVAMAAANAVYAQQQADVAYQSATSMSVAQLEDLDTSGCGTYLTAALLAACATSG